MAQLKLGAPSLIGEAALNEGLSALKADSLIVWLQNQTPDKQTFGGIHLPYDSVVKVEFGSAMLLHKWCRSANQIGLLHGMEGAFVVHDEDPNAGQDQLDEGESEDFTNQQEQLPEDEDLTNQQNPLTEEVGDATKQKIELDATTTAKVNGRKVIVTKGNANGK